VPLPLGCLRALPGAYRLTYLATVTAPSPTRIAGLTEPVVSPLERVPIRTRESGVTLAAWKLAASAPEGSGTMVRVETAAGSFYRGDGWFLGWTQEALGTAWTQLLPPAPRDTFELAQLG
jgi:hypothetical protein